MININKYLILFFLMPLFVIGQANQIQGFENLVNKTWIADGEWSNGSQFKQEVYYSYSLNKTIVIADSKGFTNQEQTEYGIRNHGIRQYNKTKNTVEFWEFDVFGGVTKGTVEIIDKNICYRYIYGEATVTDFWEYVNDSTYNYTVGIYKDDKWDAIYLQTVFKLKKE